jgi:translation initiation factor 1A
MAPFKKKPKPKHKSSQQPQDQVIRLKLPTSPETFGVLEQRLGASRLRVRCLDGHTRICRIPGRLKRRLWVREGDIVIVEPWEFGGDEKGDILYKYTLTQAKALRAKGYLKNIEEFDEF